MINPKLLSDRELYEYVTAMIRDGYEELPNYTYVMPDMLTVGVHKFNADLILTRGWQNRILGMLQQARQIKAHASAMAEGKKRLHEYDISDYITKESNRIKLKGLDASERKIAARRACSESEEVADEWNRLVGELRAYVDVLEEKLRNLGEAKNDLRAQLWAVRVHGVLGELSHEARSDDVGPVRQTSTHEVTEDQVGRIPWLDKRGSEMVPAPPVPDNPVQCDPEMDRLLGDDKE